MKTVIIILSMALTACGIEEEVQDECGTDTVSATECVERDSTPAPTSDGVRPSLEETESVSGSGSVARDAAHPLIMPYRLTWNEAMVQAPSGYRIPTRGDVILYSENFDVETGILVWTADNDGETTSWAAYLKNGQSFSYNRETRLNVIYVASDD